MARYYVKSPNCNEPFRFNPESAETSFREARLDFVECVKGYAETRYSVWDVINNPSIDVNYVGNEFINSIVECKNPDFMPIGGDRNAVTRLTIRKYFPDMYVDEYEDYWTASEVEDFVSLVELGLDFTPYCVTKDGISLSATLDKMTICVILEYLPPAMPVEFKKAFKNKDPEAVRKTFIDLFTLNASKTYDCFIMFDVGEDYMSKR